MPVKDYYHDIDLHANQLFNSRLHNISTAARITLGGSLGVTDKGYQVYDTDLLTAYFWNGTAWQAAGGGGTVWGSITGDIEDQTDLTSYFANNYYPLSSNPAGYLDSAAGDLLYYPLSLNPANYLDATAAGLLYYPLSSNPAGYLTASTVPVPTLQDVTDAGKITTNDIEVDFLQTNGDVLVGKTGSGGGVVICDGGNYKGFVYAANLLSSDRTLQLPDNNGTFAISVNGVAADSTGDISIAIGNVSGSGTTNYVPKWTVGGSVLGDSLVYDSGTYVGIGTASPTYKLDVNGDVKISGKLNFNNTTTTQIKITCNGDSIGGTSISSDLILIGRYSGFSLQSAGGSSLIAIGYGAGINYTTGGTSSVHIGRGSGRGITVGAFNTHVGMTDTTNIPSGTSYTLHLIGAGGYESNDAAAVLSGLTTRYAVIGGGYSATSYINDFYFGGGPYVKLPSSGHLNFYSPSGNGTDLIGSNFTINAGRGTGTGTPGNFIVKTATSTTTGTTVQSLTERFRIAGETGNITASSLAGVGSRMVIADATGLLSTQSIPSTTGYVPYTGATSDVNLGEWGLSQLGYAQFDITPSYTTGAVGKMVWNDTDGTLDLGLKGGNVTLQLGQEQVARVVNKTSPLVDLLEADYQVCLVTGATGQRLSVRLAQADSDANSAGTLGVVTETILKNQEGFITISGQIHEINTTGALQGETWTDGDILYLSPTTAGAITNIKPTAPQHSVIIGYVEYAHAIHGKIFVKIDNGYELGELHNVYIPTPSNKDGIFWSTANSRYENNSISGILGYTPADNSGVVHITGTETITGAKTFSTNNVRFGTTIFDVTNNRLTYSGATGASRINLPDAGTTLTDGINWGDIAVYRGSASTLYIGQIGIATRHLRIGIQAGIVNLAASGSSATPVLNLSTTQSGSSVLGIGGTDNNVTIAANTLTGSMATAALSISQTWNTTGNPTAILLNITNTAVGASARLMDLIVGGVSRFYVSSGGGAFSNGFYIGSGSSVRGFTMSGATSLVTTNQVGFQDASSITQTSNYNYSCFSVAPTFNITGTGITRGIYINPTLTSANDFRAFDAANGSIVLPYTGQTTTYAIKTSDHLINCTSGTFTATLPTAVGCTGKHYTIKNSGSGAITIATTSSQTIDGSITYSLGSQYKYVRLVSDGANWIIIGNN